MKIKITLFLLFTMAVLKLLCQPSMTVQKIVPSDPAEEDWFGISIASNEETLAIGAANKSLDNLKAAGAVYLYEKRDKQWVFSHKITPPSANSFDFFGEDVYLAGNSLLIGAKGDNRDTLNDSPSSKYGAVFEYEKNDRDKWVLINQLTEPLRGSSNEFGSAFCYWNGYLCISSPGYTQPDAQFKGRRKGCIYIFQHQPDDRWKLLQVISPNDSVPDSKAGEEILLKDSLLFISSQEGDWNKYEISSGTGAVYIYKLNKEGKWVPFQKLTPEAKKTNRNFGRSIGYSSDFIFVGSEIVTPETWGDRHHVKGTVDVFRKSENGKFVYDQSLYPPDTTIYNWFGNSIDARGRFVTVGAMGEQRIDGVVKPYVGAVYLFEKVEGKYEMKEQIHAIKKHEWDKFGFSVKMLENQLIVGARFENNHDSRGNPIIESGAVYVFPIK